ncbi:amino acid permease [Vibrio sagamiensis]|uniref:Tyrosine transporter n=1 Tax=Vibrio sagamiensis NBRC 104589 TaxID=1219064 RepID=A0A511QGY6_9VIBR|nr:aromatic amino acid transport family protein [Vibrio sagamiensis]PNQ54896.1 tyrosine transporter [Vibrio agarivorans]GEM76574.1 tyrosine transporter [Vibrio sagamiensis NBRC 104589]
MNLKLLGSSLIVAGTALGAGMLAIPMVLAQFGLLWGTLFMLFIWLGTTYAALMLLEASCRVGGGISMNAIARDTLGTPGQLITNILLYALLVCLLMAYIIGAGDVITQVVSSLKFELAPYVSQIAFTLLFGIIISSGTKIVDLLNRGLFIAMITALVLTLGFLAPNITLSGIGDTVNTDVFALFQTSSVVFTSFGFMVVIPSLVSYNKEATKFQLRNMIIVGSLIPLVCYLLWLFAVIGNLPPQKLTQFSDLSELIATLGQQYSSLEFILSIFTGLALLTSFLGVAMALYDQNADLLNANKPIVFGTTFILPLIGALFAQKYFLAILGYAGIILVFLAIFLPLAMMISARSRYNEVKDVYQVGGGNLGIALIFSFGCFLIFAQLM